LTEQSESLSLTRRDDAAEVLRKRALTLQALRAQFDEEGFLEADVPMLLPHAGQEPHLHAPAVDWPGLPSWLWLQTSPELPLKRLLCSGVRRLYFLGAAYRGGREELSDHHQPQFSMLEWYEPGDGVGLLAQRCRQLGAAVGNALGLPSLPAGEVIELAEAFRRWAGLDLEPLLDGDRPRFLAEASRAGFELRDQDDTTAWVGRVLVERIEPALAREPGWIFLHGYPAEMAALSEIDPDDPRKSLRIEAYLHGVEIGNGYVELLDAGELERRWIAERTQREGPSPPIDTELLAELHAMDARGDLSPTVGMAVGVDRLLMACLGETRLDAVLPLSLSLKKSLNKQGPHS
jgi:elongation factor P--(R)-beta-lysine ligase